MKSTLASSLSSPAATGATRATAQHRSLQRVHRNLERVSGGVQHRALSEDQLLHSASGSGTSHLNPLVHRPLGQSSSAGALLTAESGRSPRRPNSPARGSPLPSVYEHPRGHGESDDDDDHESVADSVSTSTSYSRTGRSPEYAPRRHQVRGGCEERGD